MSLKKMCRGCQGSANGRFHNRISVDVDAVATANKIADLMSDHGVIP